MTGNERTIHRPLRILIVAGDGRVRRALRALLEAQPDMVVTGEAATAAQAVQCGTTLCPSVVLLDLMLPTPHDGLAAVRLLATHQHPCVAMSWHGSLRQAALEAGAGAFVEKGAAPEMVLAALRNAGGAGEQQGRNRRDRPELETGLPELETGLPELETGLPAALKSGPRSRPG